MSRRISENKISQFSGRRLFFVLEPSKEPKRMNGRFTESLLQFSFGMSFEQFLQKGGSVVRLAWLVRDGAVTVS